MGYQLNKCLSPIFLYQALEFLKSFFFDNMWMSNFIVSSGGFTINLPSCINTNKDITQTIYKSSSIGDTSSDPSSHSILPFVKSLRSVAFNITGISKHKTDSSNSLSIVKYHSNLNTCLLCNPGKFCVKCGVGHNVLTLQHSSHCRSPLLQIVTKCSICK